MGHVPNDLHTSLECLWVLGDDVPNDPRTYTFVARGLACRDSDIRELAIGVAHCLGAYDMLAVHATREPAPWLVRYSTLP